MWNWLKRLFSGSDNGRKKLPAVAPPTPVVQAPKAAATTAEAYFSPGDTCREALIEALLGAKTSIDICVFTITDDRIAGAILEAHRRNVTVRVITDDERSGDDGSDAHKLRKAGIPVRTDATPGHMHHKFALFDGRVLATGSFNWTRSASVNNHENVILVSDTRLVRSFATQFETLWKQFSRNALQ